MAPSSRGAVLKLQYPHRFVQNGTCTYSPSVSASGGFSANTDASAISDNNPSSPARVITTPLRNIVRESPPAEPVPVTVPRPVDEEGLPPDLVALDEAPVTAVLRVVAVVAHDEVGVGRHCRGLAAVRVPAIGLPSARRAGIGVLGVRLLKGPAVDEDLVATDLHSLGRGRDDPFDEVALLVLRVLEHDDVAASRIANRGHAPVDERELWAVEELVDQDVVADEERVHHGAGGDGEGLHDERTDDERQQDRDRDRLGVLADDGLPARLRHDYLRGERAARFDLDLSLVHGQLLRTERNASWGTSTFPTCFIRFFPAFWPSRSLRLRVMSSPSHFPVPV